MQLDEYAVCGQVPIRAPATLSLSLLRLHSPSMDTLFSYSLFNGGLYDRGFVVVLPEGVKGHTERQGWSTACIPARSYRST